MAQLTGRNALDLALRGGEDYELLFTATTDPNPLLGEAVPDLSATRIGDMSGGEPMAHLVQANGVVEPLRGGFDHLRGMA